MSEYVTFDQLREELRKKPDLVEVVRCRDCKHAFKTDSGLLDCTGPLTTSWDYYNDDFQINEVEPDGFCAWGNRVEFVTCKCGQDIEAVGEMQVCPSCGRKVMA